MQPRRKSRLGGTLAGSNADEHTLMLTTEKDEIAEYARYCRAQGLEWNDAGAVDAYIGSWDPEKASRQGITRAKADLKRWHRAHAAGRIFTECCTTCGCVALSMMEEFSSLDVRQCDLCTNDVCELCDQHIAGPDADLCLCVDCASGSGGLPEELASVEELIRDYMTECDRRLEDYTDARRLAAYIRREGTELPEETRRALTAWTRREREGESKTIICRDCRAVAVCPRGNTGAKCHNCGEEID